jgi:hypothetical protein
MEATDTRERLARDAFPVEVLDSRDGTFATGCRAFVTTERILVWREVGGRPDVLLNEPVTEQVERNRGSLGSHLSVEVEGGTIHLSRGRGCGCHSVLRALPPPVAW